MTWREVVTSLYPAALSRTYCVPPVHFSRVPYVREIVPGTDQPAFVLGRPSGPKKSKPTLLDPSASSQTQSLPPSNAQTILGDADTNSKSAAASVVPRRGTLIVVAHRSQLSPSGAAANREVPRAPQGQSSCLNPPGVVSARTVHTERLASDPASASQTAKPCGGARSVRHVPAKTGQLAGSTQSVRSVSTKPNHSQQTRSALSIDRVNPIKTVNQLGLPNLSTGFPSRPVNLSTRFPPRPVNLSTRFPPRPVNRLLLPNLSIRFQPRPVNWLLLPNLSTRFQPRPVNPAATAQSVDTVPAKTTRSAVIAQSIDTSVSPQYWY